MVVCRLMELKMRTQEKKEVDPSRKECVEGGREEFQDDWAWVTECQTTVWVYRKCWMVQRLRTAKTVKKVKGEKCVPNINSLIFFDTTCRTVDV